MGRSCRGGADESSTQVIGFAIPSGKVNRYLENEEEGMKRAGRVYRKDRRLKKSGKPLKKDRES